MTKIDYKLEEHRQKRSIGVYALLCVLIAALVGFYSYSKWQTYTMAVNGIAQNKQAIIALRTASSNEKAQLDSQKDAFNLIRSEIEKKLKVIFPSTDDYTTLTRQFDVYEKDLSTQTNPFEVANIDYQAPIVADQYSILPLRMSIRSSNENFTKFLHMIENSGNLKDNIRLMEVSSIRLNFENNTQDKTAPEIINFSVQINAYFQK